MTDIIITGFMGTGKTTVGRLLAHIYGLEFVDCDDEVEHRAGRSIADLWRAESEEAFRAIEAEVFADLLATVGDRVIATGGGTLLSEDTRGRLRPEHRVFSLTCRVDELAGRLASEVHTRPVLALAGPANLNTHISDRLAARSSVYDRFETVDTSGCSPAAVAAEIGRRAGLHQAALLTWPDQRETRVQFGNGLMSSLGDLLKEFALPGDALLVSDDIVADRGWTESARGALDRAGYRTYPIALPSGETYKTLDTVQQIYRVALEAHLDRSAIVVGVGGGVIGDMAGLAAATYLRGIRLVLVPTTLLAQVDGAIGGKVGVDFAGVKNLVGAFQPADLVAIDPQVLATLPDGALADGLAEVVKIAFVRSATLLERVTTLAVAREILDCTSIIRAAAVEKVKLVQLDPYERGDRALLNFGHTIGHGVEAASGYALSHGQAVAAGMVAELALAEEKGWCSPGLSARLQAILTRFHLPLAAPGLDPAEVYRMVAQDKKRRAGRIRLAIPVTPGQGQLREVEENDVRRAIDAAVGN
jgi:shikimate kinase/3-dehydroquinate synthase